MKKYTNIVILVAIVSIGFIFTSPDNFLKRFMFGQIITAAPFPPYGLKATVVNYNQINVSWVDDSVNAMSSRKTKEFRLYRRTAYTGNWELIKTTINATHADLNLSPGGYDYKVNACNDIGCSSDSGIISASFSKDTMAPTRPGNFSLPQKEVTDSKANLYWSASIDDIGIRQYNIYRSAGSGNNPSLIASVSLSQVIYTDTSLSPVTNHYYYVEAVDLAKNKSLATATLNIVTLPLGNTGSYIRVVSPNGGECFTLPGNLHVAWTGTGVNQATAYYGGKKIFSGKDTIFDWYMTASVSPTTIGSIKIIVVDDNGKEGTSDTSDAPFAVSRDCKKESISIASTPEVPTNLKAGLVPNGNDILLTWQDNSKNETEFRIYRRVLNGKWALIAKVGPDVTSYTDPNVPPGNYEYDAHACNNSGCSAYSNQFKITAIATLPVDPVKVYTVAELRDGDLVSVGSSSDPDVYIINSHGYKRLFLNEAIFGFYGHLGGFQNIKKIDSTAKNSYRTSGLFKNCEAGDGKVYGVEISGEDTAILHWVNTSGEQAIADDPDFFKKVFCINNNEFNWYQKGLPYTSVNQIPMYSR